LTQHELNRSNFAKVGGAGRLVDRWVCGHALLENIYSGRLVVPSAVRSNPVHVVSATGTLHSLAGGGEGMTCIFARLRGERIAGLTR